MPARLTLFIRKAWCFYIALLCDPLLFRPIVAPHLIDGSAHAIPRQRDGFCFILHRSQAGYFRCLRRGRRRFGRIGWPCLDRSAPFPDQYCPAPPPALRQRLYSPPSVSALIAVSPSAPGFSSHSEPFIRTDTMLSSCDATEREAP